MNTILIILSICLAHILLLLLVHRLLKKNLRVNSQKRSAQISRKILMVLYFIVTPIKMIGNLY